MIGRTNAGGGGTGKAFAAISVAYPAGSVCTCSNGGKTLKAKGTSGSFVFVLPSGGNWTVTATNGTDTANETLTIVEHSVQSVDLAYSLLLIDGNWLNPLFTVGVKGYSNARANMTDEGLYLYTPLASNSFANGFLDPSIDISAYKSLEITWKAHGYGGSLRAGLVTSVSSSVSLPQTYAAMATIEQSNSTWSGIRTDKINISGLGEGLYYFCCSAAGSGGQNTSGEVLIAKAVLKRSSV